MKIKNAMMRLHFKTANSKIERNYKSSTEIRIYDSKDNIYLELLSFSDEIMPDFSEYIEKTIVIITEDGKIRGVIKDVKKWFGQDVYIIGDIISENDWFLNWNCHYGYWDVEPKELYNSLIKSPLAQYEISLDEYLLIQENVNKLYSKIYDKLNDCYYRKDKTTFTIFNLTDMHRDKIEKFLKDVLSKALYIKRNEPKLYELIISALENKQQ